MRSYRSYTYLIPVLVILFYWTVTCAAQSKTKRHTRNTRLRFRTIEDNNINLKQRYDDKINLNEYYDDNINLNERHDENINLNERYDDNINMNERHDDNCSFVEGVRSLIKSDFSRHDETGDRKDVAVPSPDRRRRNAESEGSGGRWHSLDNAEDTRLDWDDGDDSSGWESSDEIPSGLDNSDKMWSNGNTSPPTIKVEGNESTTMVAETEPESIIIPVVIFVAIILAFLAWIFCAAWNHLWCFAKRRTVYDPVSLGTGPDPNHSVLPAVAMQPYPVSGPLHGPPQGPAYPPAQGYHMQHTSNPSQHAPIVPSAPNVPQAVGYFQVQAPPPPHYPLVPPTQPAYPLYPAAQPANPLHPAAQPANPLHPAAQPAYPLHPAAQQQPESPAPCDEEPPPPSYELPPSYEMVMANMETSGQSPAGTTGAQ